MGTSDGTNATNCFGTAGSVTGQICLATSPTSSITISDSTPIDTRSVSASCVAVVSANPSAAAYCVVAGNSITIAAGKVLSATGDRPLVLLSTSTIVVSGTIDVASHETGSPQSVGAGADPATCIVGSAPTGGGGGYGGSFVDVGAAGGTSKSPSGAGGAAAAVAAATTLRGGCKGSYGGGASGGAGGDGGGAVALIAAETIEIDGEIDASGAGGHSPPTFVNGTIYGGGGGGAGGMIVFDAAMVTGAGASIFANGGGGGEASQFNITGAPGHDPTSPNQAAAGGAGSADNFAGDGGNGAFGTTPATAGHDVGTGTDQSYGGGGGGGARGIIRVFRASSLPGTVSPQPS